jgi:hypothetical protein
MIIEFLPIVNFIGKRYNVREGVYYERIPHGKTIVHQREKNRNGQTTGVCACYGNGKNTDH